MPNLSNATLALLNSLKQAREFKGITVDQVEEKLKLGPGWINAIENGLVTTDLDTFIFLASLVELDSKEISKALDDRSTEDSIVDVLDRSFTAEQQNNDLIIKFNYGSHDATYLLEGATLKQFEDVVKQLRDGLAVGGSATPDEQNNQFKATAVKNSFEQAMKYWPDANPSDIWYFLIYRAFCDRYNHPSNEARLAFEQSWKRTGGWALEMVMVDHYAPTLAKKGIKLEIVDKLRATTILDRLNLDVRLEADKVDAFLFDENDDFFGIINVKASFAERRTDDVPMSEALNNRGYYSALWTMDCKANPGPNPYNKGELGSPEGKRSAKRKDIEDEGYFTACFSYNQNTQPTSRNRATKGQVIICDFKDPDDAFVEHIVEAYQEFMS